MAKRFRTITDPEGNIIDPLAYRTAAYIERLDGRNPLYKYYKYRFSIQGGELTTKFLRWMLDTFGPSMGYNLARHNVKCNVSLKTVPWVIQNETRSYWANCHIYFNQECEVLIRLKFMQGSPL